MFDSLGVGARAGGVAGRTGQHALYLYQIDRMYAYEGAYLVGDVCRVG